MVLVETMTQAWTQYRNGLVFAVGKKDLDSAIVYIKGMWAMLPEKDRGWTDKDGVERNELPPVPTAKELKDMAGSQLTVKKWNWVQNATVLIEERISGWVHHNIDMAYNR